MNVVNRLALFLVVLASGVAAQNQRSSPGNSSNASYDLVSLEVTGTKRYADKEILAASGLQIGQNAADPDFKEAARRLVNSGMFSDVDYSFRASGPDVKLDFRLSDIDESKLVPAHFENLIWFTDQELRAAVQRRVPLFKLLLPVIGSLPDEVSEALQSILSDRQLPGRVDYQREGDDSGGPLTGITYRVEEVSIEIRNVEFPGASPVQAAQLAAVARRFTGTDYLRSSLAVADKIDFLPIYLKNGYLKAVFQASNARVVPRPQDADTEGPHELLVDALIPVVPGEMYSTSGITLKGNSAVKTADIAPLIQMPLGQPADAIRLRSNVQNVSKLYRSRGYMMVQIKAEAQFDDEKSAVHYHIDITEGDVYRMGDLEILGLDTQATARMIAAWALPQGQPYNADYLRKFLSDTADILPRGIQWTTEIHETPEVKDKTVDVEIRFK
ncbi:MAG: POTRA domain-containing protein [Terriglobales bacterium]